MLQQQLIDWIDALSRLLVPAVSAMGQAPAAGGEQPGFAEMIFPIAMMLGIIYFLMIRPQRKQMLKHQQFVASIEKGSEVVTSGGIIGKVVGIADGALTLQIAENTKIKVLKSHISSRSFAKEEAANGNLKAAQ